MWSVWLIFCNCGFHSSALWWISMRDLWKLPGGRYWLWGNLGLALMGRAMLNKSLIQFSVEWLGSVPSLLFGLRPNYKEGTQPHPSQKIELKIYWAWPCPSEQDPDSPTASPSHREVSMSLLFLPIRGQTIWKQQLQITNQTRSLGS